MAAAFRNALQRIGFSIPTSQKFVDEGFTSIASLAEMSDGEIEELCKHISRWRTAPDGAQVDDITLPFLSVKRLRGMRLWVIIQQRMGLPVQAGSFTNGVATSMLERIRFVDSIEKANKEASPTKPKVLASFTEWRAWWESWVTYTSQLRGANSIPLPYVYRSHDDVTPELRAAVYANTDAEYSSCYLLIGPDYQADNKRIYDELKPLVIDGPAWTFIRSHDSTSNGRGAVLALKLHAEGESSKKLRSDKAYNDLASARYSGPTRNFSLADYIQIHCSSYAELEELTEMVSESKKVTDFLQGISDPRLKSCKDIIVGDPVKNANFTTCHQYVQTVHSALRQQDKRDRQVAGVDGGDRGRGRGRTQGRGRGRGRNGLGRGRGTTTTKTLSLNSTDSYSNAEWEAMGKAGNDKVTLLRKMAQKSKADARQVAAAAASVASTPGTAPVPENIIIQTTNDAGNQFGRGAHKKAKTN